MTCWCWGSVSFGAPAPHLLCLDFNSLWRLQKLLSTIYKCYIHHLNAQELMNSHEEFYPQWNFIAIMSLNSSVWILRTSAAISVQRALRLIQTTKIHERKGDWEVKENGTDTDFKGRRW